MKICYLLVEIITIDLQIYKYGDITILYMTDLNNNFSSVPTKWKNSKEFKLFYI